MRINPRRLALSAFLAFGWVGAAEKAAPSGFVVIRGGEYFDVESGRMQPLIALVIAGDRIQQMVPAGGTFATPAGAREIDARGKFMIPGLIDGHTHVAHVLREAGINAEEILPLHLANGITTLRDTGDPLEGQQRIARFIDAHPDLQRIPARLRNFWLSTAQGAGTLPETMELRRGQFGKLQELTGVLYRAGVELMVGTDAPIHFCPPGLALHQELELLVAAGVPPGAALVAATRHNARALNQAANLGSIEPGKLADLVLLDANPLADIRNTRKIALVIRGGIACEPAALLNLVPAQ